jgi:hypothetical protein
MSEIIPSDNDDIIREEDIPPEYDQVPVVDEPDDDEGEAEDEGEGQSWRYQ